MLYTTLEQRIVSILFNGKKKDINKLEFWKILFFTFFHIYFLNVNIFITPDRLYLSLVYVCFKFENIMLNGKLDIHVQKLFVKNLIFVFPDPDFCQFSKNLHIIYIIM